MTYLEKLKENADETRTLNGAKTWGSTGDACLDLFSAAGGMRYRRPVDQIRLFTKAYLENPELAMKLLFYIRDIRGGMGERQLFRTLIRRTAKIWPESAKKNVRLIAEYGRFDDLWCLMGTKAEKEVLRVVRERLDADLAALARRESGEKDAPISLLAKWMPSINTSAARTRGIAQKLCTALGMTARDYRRMLSRLRAHICLTERYLTDNRPEKIRYPSVPAGAMLKYRSAFEKKDGERYLEYLTDVDEGKLPIRCETLFPYEIIRPYFDSPFEPVSPDGAEVLELLWENLPAQLGSENAICVIDTSGSMYCRMSKNAVTPALISQSLGLYHAERCKGPFHNHFITFESTPHLIEVRGKTLFDKLNYIAMAPWGGSTNLEAVFDLILKTAVDADAAQDEMPAVLYIISDMEFNSCVDNPNETVYENARERFEAAGYRMPASVFINVNSWQTQAPVRAHQKGAALASGMGVNTFGEKFDGNVTPMSHMMKVLMSERYREVHA